MVVKGKMEKVGKAGKRRKMPRLGASESELQSTAIKAKENVEGFYVHPELVKPILDSNLKKVARQKWKRRLKGLPVFQFENLLIGF